MDDTNLADLRAYYESLSDEALLAEGGQGSQVFTPEAWRIVSELIERRGLKHHHTSHRDQATQHGATAAERRVKQPSLDQRLAARVDALPPTLRPAAFGASIVVRFALARGAWWLVPLAVIYVLATRPHPWASIMTGVEVTVLVVAGGALSGFTYSLVGQRMRASMRGGYYLTGLVTLAPYMFMLAYALRIMEEGVPLWHRPVKAEFAASAFMTLLFGLLLSRGWFGPKEEGERAERAT
jgi:hypothetical protein